MSDEIQVRLRILSRMTDPDGEVNTIRSDCVARMTKLEDGVRFIYDEERDGERARISLSISGDRAQMERRGMTGAHLSFIPGTGTVGRYTTVYGEIPVRIETKSVSLEPEGNSGHARMLYDVFAGGEKTASTDFLIGWKEVK